MRKLFQIFTILLILLSICYCQKNQANTDSIVTETAIEAADSWLKLVDGNKYGESWEQTASLFKNAVSKQKWEQSLKGILPPFGQMISREVESATYKTSLPGAPDGDYVVIIYKTKYEKKEKSIETVTPMKDEDGIWRVSGYFIK